MWTVNFQMSKLVLEKAEVGKEDFQAVYCHPAYSTSMQNAGLDEA